MLLWLYNVDRVDLASQRGGYSSPSPSRSTVDEQAITPHHSRTTHKPRKQQQVEPNLLMMGYLYPGNWQVFLCRWGFGRAGSNRREDLCHKTCRCVLRSHTKPTPFAATTAQVFLHRRRGRGGGVQRHPLRVEPPRGRLVVRRGHGGGWVGRVGRKEMGRWIGLDGRRLIDAAEHSTEFYISTNTGRHRQRHRLLHRLVAQF